MIAEAMAVANMDAADTADINYHKFKSAKGMVRMLFLPYPFLFLIYHLNLYIALHIFRRQEISYIYTLKSTCFLSEFGGKG